MGWEVGGLTWGEVNEMEVVRGGGVTGRGEKFLVTTGGGLGLSNLIEQIWGNQSINHAKHGQGSSLLPWEKRCNY